MISDEQIREIARRALNLRRSIIRMLAAAGSGHPAGALGLADIFATLYFGGVLRFGARDFANFDFSHANSDEISRILRDPNRDLLVLSNGHVCPVLYATFAELGAISDAEMLSLRKFGSRLQGHPEREMLDLLETTSGPLGEGLSQAAGMAYAIKNFAKDNSRKIFCVVGDGELDEGENWEAIMFAAKNHLSNLCAIVDRNSIQLSGTTEEIMPLEPLAAKFRANNWNVIEIDGNDIREISFAFAKAREMRDAPTAIIARTIPGKGVSFMENDYRWHGKAPNEEEAEIALAELNDSEK